MKLPFKLFVTLAVSILLAACGTDSGSGGSAGSDSLAAATPGVTVSGASGGKPAFSLRLTDAPLDDVVAVVLRFTEVRVRNLHNDWTSYRFDTPQSVDLLQLQGAKTADLLVNMPLDEGDYDEIRLFVDDTPMANYVDLGAAGLAELQVRDGSTKGIKIDGYFSVTDSRAASLVIDFDLRKSVRYSKKSGEYSFKSKLRLVSLFGSGHIRGTVDPALLSSTPECSDDNVDTFNAVYVFEGHDAKPDDIDQSGKKDKGPIATAAIKYDSASMTYRYEAAFLPAGKYTLALTCNADLDDLDQGNDKLRFFGTRNATVILNDIVFL